MKTEPTCWAYLYRRPPLATEVRACGEPAPFGDDATEIEVEATVAHGRVTSLAAWDTTAGRRELWSPVEVTAEERPEVETALLRDADRRAREAEEIERGPRRGLYPWTRDEERV